MNIIRFCIVDYCFARNMQRYLVAKRVAGEIEDTVLFCQHFSVVTLGKRAKVDSVERTLADISYPTIKTDRGGLLTFHNPGQLMIYPVVSLKQRRVGVREFVRLGLAAIVLALEGIGVSAYYLESPAGVFVDHLGIRKKIGYVGLKISQGVSDHGFSVNINNDLSVFNKISSCGLPVGEVVSLQQLVSKESGWREFSLRIEAAFCELFSN